MIEATGEDFGYDVERYFQLVERGIIDADDHVELLEGIVVASPPQSPLHASVLMSVDAAIRKAVGNRASIRPQLPLIAGKRSVPEPDLTVVPGGPVDYRDSHPTTALLAVEISDSSLPQDRLSKSRIYAGAAVLEYWIVNLRNHRVEVHTRPDRKQRVYESVRNVACGEAIELAAFPGTRVAVSDFFPGY